MLGFYVSINAKFIIIMMIMIIQHLLAVACHLSMYIMTYTMWLCNTRWSVSYVCLSASKRKWVSWIGIRLLICDYAYNQTKGNYSGPIYLLINVRKTERTIMKNQSRDKCNIGHKTQSKKRGPPEWQFLLLIMRPTRVYNPYND